MLCTVFELHKYAYVRCIPEQTRVPKPPPFGGFEKLKSKGAIKEVSSCSNDFLSNIFLVNW